MAEDDDLRTEDSGPFALEEGLRAAYGADHDSVLSRIEAEHGARSRVLLRDPPGNRSPVLRVLAHVEKSDARYHVIGEIARGGVGVIYQGRDRDLGREVALKVLRRDLIRRGTRDLADRDWSRLLEMARVADPDPWRDRLRDAAVRADRPALLGLATERESRGDIPILSVLRLGTTLLGAGEREAAVALLRRLVRNRPNEPMPWSLLGQASITLDPPRAAEAARAFAVAAALRPGQAHHRMDLAMALHALGDRDGARATLEDAKRLAAGNEPMLRQIASAYRTCGLEQEGR